MNRKLLLAVLTALLMLPVFTPLAATAQTDDAQPITVYKTPTCGCCSDWVAYLEERGFAVTTHDLPNLDQVKRQHGLTDPRLASCHTAIVDGYVVEGHVPANDIRRLLSERPPIIGLTAPGMPRLSPGMMSVEPKDYDVLSFDDAGKVRVFSRY